MGILSRVLLPFRVITPLSARKELSTYRRGKGNLIYLSIVSSARKLTLAFRYVNTDYAVASTLADDIAAGVTDVVITYDIGCQWGKNFSERLPKYSSAPPVNIKSLKTIRFAVPKFHIITHATSCQAAFNLTYMDGVGMTHGEGVETIWASSTSLAIWSRENGPGARHLILDDHWNGWNWRKYIGLCKCPIRPLTQQLTPTQAPS